MKKQMTKNDLKLLLRENKELMEILGIVQELSLKDSWVAAGAVRNVIWNALSGKAGFDWDSDVDLVFFDPNMTYEDTLKIEEELNKRYPIYQWQVRNQVHMHRHNPKTAPYLSACDAISKYPETFTSIALRLQGDELVLFAPYGIEAILTFECHPTPYFLENPERMAIYRKRFSQKNWRQKWPYLTFFED